MRFNSDTYSSSGTLYHQSSNAFFFLPSYMTDTRFRSQLGGCGTDDSLTFALNDHKETKYRAYVSPELVFIMIHTWFAARSTVTKPDPSMLDALTGLTHLCGPRAGREHLPFPIIDPVQRSIDTELCSTQWTHCNVQVAPMIDE